MEFLRPQSRHLILVLWAITTTVLFLTNSIYPGLSPVASSQSATSDYEIPVLGHGFSISTRQASFGFGAFAIEGSEVFVQNGSPRGYSLPIEVSQVENWEDAISSSRLGIDGSDKLRENGFVVVRDSLPNLIDGYRSLLWRRMPFYVSSDAVLLINHIFYNSLVAEVEERYVSPKLERLLFALSIEGNELLDKLPEGTQARAGANANLEYLYLTLGLKSETFRERWSSNQILEEYELIMSPEGAAISPLFGYVEDYSQYTPRGHYTSSDEFTDYFRTITWLSRMRFDLNSDLQTMQSLLLTYIMNDGRVGNQSAYEAWESIYDATAFFVGESDDLTFREYRAAMEKVYGESPALDELSSSSLLEKYREELFKLDRSRILGNVGAKDETIGLRFLGQRFTIDSYVHSSLSHDQVDSRFMVKGLDIPASLGSSIAEAYLQSEFETYANYRDALEDVRSVVGEIPESEWNRNLYMGSINSLRTLLKRPSDGLPAFMLSDAWEDRSLNTFLAGWSLLRHDSISYTKQAYAEAVLVPPEIPGPERVAPQIPIAPPAPHYGYVEPQPHLYSRMKLQSEATLRGLEEIGVLDNDLERRLRTLSTMMEYLVNISLKEITGQELNDFEENLLVSFGGRISDLLRGLRFAEFTERIWAKDPDVFSDPNSGLKLEAETGMLDTILVVYETPDGRMFVGAGIALTYYEFTSEERLTDEKWEEMLKSGNPPGEPVWVKNYVVDRIERR